jgi:outer membrane protein OmpA-like peptidoglycan-associated protein
MTRIRRLLMVLTAAGPLLVAATYAAEADSVLSREAIEAALQPATEKPLEMKTRGLRVQPRAAESRGAIDLQVAFAINSAALLPDAQQQLRELAAALQSPRLSGQAFELAGHTDATGSPQRNRELSLARAIAVRDYLAAEGVNAAALTVAGHGSDRPLAGIDPRDAHNRRVEVRALRGTP